MTSGMPIEAAAQALDVSVPTLRRWIRRGCPVLCRGSRGRGHALLLDPGQVTAWRQAGDVEAMTLELAAQVPDVLANAMLQALQQAQGPHKRQLAGSLTAAWYFASCVILDNLREKVPTVPELVAAPEAITRLQKIASS